MGLWVEVSGRRRLDGHSPWTAGTRFAHPSLSPRRRVRWSRNIALKSV